MKLNYKRTIFVGFAFFLISAFWQAYDAIVPLILTNHFGLSQDWSGAVMSLDNILAVFMLPLFGSLSDRCNTSRGRRTPFVLFGTVAAVVCFIVLTFIDNFQLSRLAVTTIPSDMVAAGTDPDAINEVLEKTLVMTLENPWPLVAFVGALLLVLIAMATFRSPAVALMPDVTIKPLRSKGNAIINLMGAAGGIFVLIFGTVMGVSKNKHANLTVYVFATCAVMIVGLVLFLFLVKEKQWAEEMEAETDRLGLRESENATPAESSRKLSRGEVVSLLLILASVALWYIGYNSITSKYSVYSTNILSFDPFFTLIIAQAAAIVSYIPVGIVASKLGRKKTILAGIVMLAAAFLGGHFVTPDTSEFIMYPIFILAGMGWATINVNSFPMVVELARGGDVGKYTGYYYTASMAAQIVAPIASGILYKHLGMRDVFFVFGTVFVAASFVTMFFVRHGDSKPEAQGALDSLGANDD